MEGGLATCLQSLKSPHVCREVSAVFSGKRTPRELMVIPCQSGTRVPPPVEQLSAYMITENAPQVQGLLLAVCNAQSAGLQNPSQVSVDICFSVRCDPCPELSDVLVVWGGGGWRPCPAHLPVASAPQNSAPLLLLAPGAPRYLGKYLVSSYPDVPQLASSTDLLQTAPLHPEGG